MYIFDILQFNFLYCSLYDFPFPPYFVGLGVRKSISLRFMTIEMLIKPIVRVLNSICCHSCNQTKKILKQRDDILSLYSMYAIDHKILTLILILFSNSFFTPQSDRTELIVLISLMLLLSIKTSVFWGKDDKIMFK